jgi:hypothetical protein
MLLLILYNVRSERELMNAIPVRLVWLCLLGYDLDSDIPKHSVPTVGIKEAYSVSDDVALADGR